MNSRDYWTKRVLNARQKASKNADQYETALRSRLQDLSKALEQEFKVYITKYAQANGITFREAAKYFTKPESGLFSMSLKEFETKAKTGGFKRELDSEYYKMRISRLKALRAQLADVAAQYAGLEEDKFSEKLARQYSQTYLENAHTAHNAGLGFSVDYARFNERQLKNVVYQPWAGGDFSKRIWRNYTEILPELLTDVALKSTFFGWSYQKAAQEFSKRVDGFEKKNLHRLVRTELGHIQEQATLDFYHDAKQEKYQFLAALESRTCEQCRALDMKVFDVDKAVVSENYPLIHPYCRCTTIPAQDVPLAERWYRDPVTGRGKWAKNPNPNGKSAGGGLNFLDFKKILGITFDPKAYKQADKPKPEHITVRTAAELTKGLHDLGIKEVKSLNGLRPKMYQDIYDTFEDVYTEYPELKRYLYKVRGGNRTTSNDWARFTPDFENINDGTTILDVLFSPRPVIDINKFYLRDYHEALEDIRRNVNNKWWTTKTTPAGIIKHELGHAIAAAAKYEQKFGTIGVNEELNYAETEEMIDYYQDRSFEESVLRKAFKKIGEDYEDPAVVEKYISRYGKTKIGEAFAEAFSDESDNEFTRAFHEELKKSFKEIFEAYEDV